MPTITLWPPAAWPPDKTQPTLKAFTIESFSSPFLKVRALTPLSTVFGKIGIIA